MKTPLAILALALLSTTVSAQLNTPRASPHVALTQKLGLGEVTLDYSRPSVRGREIFGGLEAYGAVWRTGADASTKISFDRAVQVGGQDVPAGTYALYTIPEADSWTLILSRNTRLWGAGGYDPADDQLRVELPVTKLDQVWETLTIDFRGFHANGAELFIRWGLVEVSVPVFTDSDTVVLAQIDELVKNAAGQVSAATYFDAAKFYVEREIEMSTAAEWVEKAVEQSPNAFWMVYYRADLARTMGDNDAAMSWATRARDIASAADNDFGYVGRSNALIDELKAAQ